MYLTYSLLTKSHYFCLEDRKSINSKNDVYYSCQDVLKMMTEKAEFVNILCDFFQPMIISYNNTNLCYDTNLSLHFLQLLDSHED